MGITMIVTGRLGKPERPSFFIPKGALTHHCPKGSGGIPPGGRAVRSSRSIRRMLLQRGAVNAAVFQTVFIACAAGRRLSPHLHLRCKSLSSVGTTCHPPAKTCHRQLCRSYGRCLSGTVHFLLSRQKKQNRPLQLGRKEVNDYGDLSPGSEGREPWSGPFRLRCVGLSELFCHL